jgi:hypothetical protein
MEWQSRIVTACLWCLPLLGVDIGYIVQHGFDAASIGFTVLAVLPAWAFLGRNVDLKFPGGGLKISGEEVGKVTARLIEAAPKAVEHVQAELPLLRQQARDRAALLPAQEAPNTIEDKPSLFTDFATALRRKWSENDYQNFLSLTAQKWSDVNLLPQIDPNLALVNLRIEIEKRLNRISELVDLPVRRLPISRMIIELSRIGVLDADFAGVLKRFVDFGNQAAHGADVDAQAAVEILQSQDLALSTLDSIIDRLSRQDQPPTQPAR